MYHVPSESAALKIWVTADPLQHERHVREVSALSRLDHPALPRVVAPIAQIEIDSQVLAFYLEQWLDAPSLKSQLSQFPFEDQRGCGLGASIADALAALHAVDIVHRDVSLGNVLASPNAGYLTDLGLAKHLDLDSLTATGELLPRTELTASPEQLQGASGDLRPPTDVFSLGVVLAIALTGRHPYFDPGENIEIGTLIHRQLAGDIRHMPQTSAGELIHRMLDPVMMFRPSASAVVEVLA